ncbi:hypothetical protein Leryth_021858 [Lithospermum erythrorhizon]|nr:hypothetical protein Leryth_021858 [Lithospermum erythrorhizon]
MQIQEHKNFREYKSISSYINKQRYKNIVLGISLNTM